MSKSLQPHGLLGSVHGILQARILEWVAISFSRDLPDPGIETVSLVSPALAGRFFITEPPGKPKLSELFQSWDIVPLWERGREDANACAPSPSGIQRELCLGDHRAFTPMTWLALISLTCLPFPPFRHSTMVHSTVVRGAPTEEEAIQELAVITSTSYFMVLAVVGLSCSNLDLQPWMRHVGSLALALFPPAV